MNFKQKTIISLKSKKDFKAVPTLNDFPYADREREWDAEEAVGNEGRVREFINGPDDEGPGDWDEDQWAIFRDCHLWYDEENPEQIGSYALPYVDVIDGELHKIPQAIFTIASVLEGAMGGVDLPGDEEDQVRERVETMYEEMREEFEDEDIVVPWIAEESKANKENDEILDKNECIEIVLSEVEYQAWEAFDNFNPLPTEDAFDTRKIATFMGEDENILVVQNAVDGKLYKIPFEYNSEDNEVEFGEMQEVIEGFIEKSIENELTELSVKSIIKGDYDNPLIDIVMYKNKYGEFPEIEARPKSKRLSGKIVSKDDEKQIVTGAVLIPDEEDYDGDIIGKEKIENVAHEWLLNYRNLDLQHTLNNVAYPVESFITREEKELETLEGETQIVPKGSWVISSKVPDEDTWQAVKNGNLTGYSIMGVEKTALQRVEKDKTDSISLKSMTMKNLNDMEDWVVPFVSLVDDPAVPKAKFYELKSKGKGQTQEKPQEKKEKKGFLDTVKNILGIGKKKSTAIKVGNNEFTIKEGRELSRQNRQKLELVVATLSDMLQDFDIELVEREGDEVVNRMTTGDIINNMEITEEDNENILNIVENLPVFNNKNKEGLPMNKEELQNILKEFKGNLKEDLTDGLAEELKEKLQDDITEDIIKQLKEEYDLKEATEEEDEGEEEKSKESDEDSEDGDAEEKSKNEDDNTVTVPKEEWEETKSLLKELKGKFKSTEKSNQPAGQEDDKGNKETTKKSKRFEGRDKLGRKIK